MIDNDLIFPFKKDGKDCGFMLCVEKDFVFKPDRYSACIIPLEILKNNLRLMVRNKTAKIVRTAAIEAVVVPKQEFKKLFI